MKIKKTSDGIEVEFTEEESKSLFTDSSKPVVTVTDEEGTSGITRTIVEGKMMTWNFTFKKGKVDYQPESEGAGFAMPSRELVRALEKELLEDYGGDAELEGTFSTDYSYEVRPIED